MFQEMLIPFVTTIVAAIAVSAVIYTLVYAAITKLQNKH